MVSGKITELRLTAFKSYRDAVIPFESLTLLVGRNGSGKSNALDALEVLSRVARGHEIRDAIEGDRRDEAIRGGLEGCAPDGGDTFSLGISVRTATFDDLSLDITVQVHPQVQIRAEQLTARYQGRELRLITSQEASVHSADIDATVRNGKRGPDPTMTFRASHLLTTQIPLRIGSRTKGEQLLVQASSELLAVVGGVFHLDPVPHLMRQYVPEQDVVLRRSADNLSAAVARLKQRDPARFRKLVEVVATLPEYDLRAIDVATGGFGDVMMAVKERRGRGSVTIPARQMSDGMLRMMAIGTALLTGGSGLAVGTRPADMQDTLMLVIEELENGLHPSQAARLLHLIKDEAGDSFQVVLTTHSPAMLNALSGDDHRGVIVVTRDRVSGASRAHRLVDLPGYTRMMVATRLGDAAVEQRIEQAAERPRPLSADELDDLLGGQ